MVKNSLKKFKIDPNVSGRILLIIVVILILAAAIILSGPTDPKTQELTITPVNLTPIPTREVLSTEYTQATGVLLAGVTIVLIVVAGTLIHLSRSGK